MTTEHGIGVRVDGEKAYLQVLRVTENGSMQVVYEVTPMNCVGIARLGDLLLDIAVKMYGAKSNEEAVIFLRTATGLNAQESGIEMFESVGGSDEKPNWVSLNRRGQGVN